MIILQFFFAETSVQGKFYDNKNKVTSSQEENKSYSFRNKNKNATKRGERHETAKTKPNGSNLQNKSNNTIKLGRKKKKKRQIWDVEMNVNLKSNSQAS